MSAKHDRSMTQGSPLLRAINAHPPPLFAATRDDVENWFELIQAGKHVGGSEFCSTFQTLLDRPSGDIWRVSALAELAQQGLAHVSIRPVDLQAILGWSVSLCALDDTVLPWLIRSKLLGLDRGAADQDVIACLRIAQARLEQQPWLFVQVIEAGVTLGFVDRRWRALDETVQWAAMDEDRSKALTRILGWYDVPDNALGDALTNRTGRGLIESIATWRATHSRRSNRSQS